MSVIVLKFKNVPPEAILTRVPFDVINANLEGVTGVQEFIELGTVTTIAVDPGLYLIKVMLANGRVVNKQINATRAEQTEVVLDFDSAMPLFKVPTLSNRHLTGSLSENPGGEAEPQINSFSLFVIGKGPADPLRFVIERPSWKFKYFIPLARGIFLNWLPSDNASILGDIQIIGLDKMQWQFGLAVGYNFNCSSYCILPPVDQLTISVIPSVKEQEMAGDNLGLDLLVSLNNPKAQSLADFFNTGDFQSVKRLSPELHGLLSKLKSNKTSDKLAALLAGYILTKTSILDDKSSQWTEALSTDFDNLPDGAVIHGWRLMKQSVPDFEGAKTELLKAASRGVPTFAIGIRMLFDGLNFFREIELAEEKPSFELELAILQLQQIISRVDMLKTVTTLSLRPDAAPDLLFYARQTHHDMIFRLAAPDLRFVSLSKIYFSNTDMVSVDMSYASLKSAFFWKSNLKDGKMLGSDFQDASMYYTTLNGAVENSVKLTTPFQFKLTTCSGRN